MDTQTQDDTTTCRLSAGSEMTIYTATEQRRQLFAGLDSCDELELDLGGVEEFDSAGLQLLLMLKGVAEKADRTLHLRNHSRAVVEVLELLNMQGYFGDPVVLPADWGKV